MMCPSFIRRIIVKDNEKDHCEWEMGKKNLNYSSLTRQIRFRQENILKLKPWKLIHLKLSTPT